MANEESNASNPKGICEKLFSAFSAKAPLQSFRSISYHKDNQVPDFSASNPSEPLPSQASNGHNRRSQAGIQSAGKPEKGKEAEVVPIEMVTLLPSPPPRPSSKEKLSTSESPKSVEEKEQVATKIAREDELKSSQVPVDRKGKGKGKEKKGGKKSKKKVDSAPTAEGATLQQETGYVTEKAEAPLLPPIQVEDGKKEELDDINDKASDYIKRAKLKIRTTSSAGIAAVGRAISFK